MLAPLERELRLGLALRALEPQDDLLRRLCLFVEHGLRLPAVAGLLAVVAALALRDGGCLISAPPGGGTRCQLCGGGVMVTGGRKKGGKRFTLPALYWVTLCWVCFLHSLPLQ